MIPSGAMVLLLLVGIVVVECGGGSDVVGGGGGGINTAEGALTRLKESSLYESGRVIAFSSATTALTCPPGDDATPQLLFDIRTLLLFS